MKPVHATASQFWDERYATHEWVYGQSPNAYFQAYLENYFSKPGRILLPAEGEGRNAVFAARKGWEVEAFDISEEGRKKALQWAEKAQLKIRYHLVGWEHFEHFLHGKYDLIALIYAHMPARIRSQVHSRLVQWLRPGGHLLLEAFRPEQLGRSSGGPKDTAMLYSPEALAYDFGALHTLELAGHEVQLQEGMFHQGNAAVVRFLGRKE